MWTRRQVLAQIGLAAAAVHTLDPHELCCVMPAHAQTASKDLFELKKVGDGVYAAIAEPRYKVNCNAAVIMTNDGVEVVASERTKENLTRPDAGVGGVPYIAKQLAALPGEIAKLKGDIQKEMDPAKKANLESNLRQAEEYQKELQSMKPALPTRTVATTTTLHEGGREIQLHVLGRAHTNGDLFIFMPKEKVVATGDALIDWMPFMNDGYPAEWPETLTTLGKLGFDHIIPGHGEVRPKSHLAFFRGYFVDLIAAVKKASADGATLDEMKTKVGDQLAAKYEGGFSKYPLGRYRDRVGTNVEAVYLKVVKKA